jgi:hypothetical protein
MRHAICTVVVVVVAGPSWWMCTVVAGGKKVKQHTITCMYVLMYLIFSTDRDWTE